MVSVVGAGGATRCGAIAATGISITYFSLG